jgi:hypothetical protein
MLLSPDQQWRLAQAWVQQAKTLPSPRRERMLQRASAMARLHLDRPARRHRLGANHAACLADAQREIARDWRANPTLPLHSLLSSSRQLSIGRPVAFGL